MRVNDKTVNWGISTTRNTIGTLKKKLFSGKRRKLKGHCEFFILLLSNKQPGIPYRRAIQIYQNDLNPSTLKS